MAAGLGVLRLEPRAFWALTLKELAAALSVLDVAEARIAPPSRGEVLDLMRLYPDREVKP